MREEQLDMHKRLQPLYKRVMGEWPIYGDKFLLKDELEINLLCYTDCCEGCRWEAENLDIIRIPLAIDSEHSERGLWGMLHKESWVIESFDTLDKITVKLRYSRRRFQVTNDPTTAILKALCCQEGV